MTPTLTEVPIERKSPTWRKWWPRTVIALLVLSALMGLMAAARVSGIELPAPPPPGPEYQTEAAEVAAAFLGGAETGRCVSEGIEANVGRIPLNNTTADDLGIDDLEQETPGALNVLTLTWDDFDVTDVGGQRIETHRFSVVTESGQAFDLSVPVADTDDGGCVAAVPALTPAERPAGTPSATLNWAESLPDNAVQPNAGVTAQVNTWAQAWAAGDERALYTLTGDSANVRYRALGGFLLAGEPTVDSAVTVDPEDPAANQIITVTLSLVDAADPEFATTVTYDLLISNPDQPLPFVVAWGSAGTGFDLEPLGNAEPPEAAVPEDTTTTAPASTDTTLDTTTTTGAGN